jgi:hypothetical protein
MVAGIFQTKVVFSVVLGLFLNDGWLNFQRLVGIMHAVDTDMFSTK